MSRYVITIGRQYGSAGREIGFKLAEELGIKCYDNELLKVAAKESGLCEQIFEAHDEKPTQIVVEECEEDNIEDSEEEYEKEEFLEEEEVYV